VDELKVENLKFNVHGILLAGRWMGAAGLCLLAVIGMGGNVHADWLVEEARWHVSAHGQVACRDCHGEIPQKAHPDPARVDRPAGAGFRPEHCTGCHGSVLSDLERGRHGGRALAAGEDYERCLACHDPHTQLRVSGAGAYDPGRPPETQCGTCHPPRERLPQLTPADEACMGCHRAVSPDAPGAALHFRALCLACHGQEGAAAGAMPVGAPAPLDLTPEGFYPHREISCLACHPAAARYGHSRQKPGDCRTCHVRHHEGIIHDAHLTVACGACHLNEILPRKDRETGTIGWERRTGAPARLHQMALPAGEDSCRRCHHAANALGAAAMVLPPKSVICMPCHAATPSASDATTLAALLVFAAGLALSLSFWFSGTIPGAAAEGFLPKTVWIAGRIVTTIFSIKIFRIAKNLMLEGLLQVKLYRQSRGRWLIHGLIVWPIFLRFAWGLAALVGSRWAPGQGWPWVLLDKNHWGHGIFFDATGGMIIAGVMLALLRRVSHGGRRLPALPRHDPLAAGLLGAVVLAGFVLSGMRIAMTGFPAGSGFSFAGDMLSRFFHGVSGLEDIYGILWYGHAVLTGAFVAYLPFSRMFHIVLAPVLIALNAAEPHPQGKGR
jgi:nitrate reductase gamma subunit